MGPGRSAGDPKWGPGPLNWRLNGPPGPAASRAGGPVGPGVAGSPPRAAPFRAEAQPHLRINKNNELNNKKKREIVL